MANSLPDDMLACAKQALANSYSPYSHFPVGVCLKGDDGNLYGGCNVENAAYPQSQCAEASAIGQMVSHGCQKIAAVLIIIPGKEHIPPCGACRQRLAEFCQHDTPVYLCATEGEHQTIAFGELLPFAFTQDSLHIKDH